MSGESSPAILSPAQQIDALHSTLSDMIPVADAAIIPPAESPYPRAAVEITVHPDWDHLPDAVARRIAAVDAPWGDCKIRRVKPVGSPEHYRILAW